MKTFRIGGIHPHDEKLSAGSSIKVLPIPKEVKVPVSQHIGAPATPIVKVGDVVKTGQLIAQATGFVSANIHSPVSGTVKKIEDFVDGNGYRKPAIIITVQGDEWAEGIDTTTAIRREITLEPAEIIKKVQEMGIVGMGGATFPAHVKLSVPPGKKCEALIINGVECEPYLTSDHRLMLEKGQEVMIGVKILMKALGVGKAYIGIENNKKDAIENLQRLSTNFEGIEVVPLKLKYPQGGEKQLIDACIRRQVPSGKLPIDVGAVVQNVGTVYAIYEAVQKNKPLIERIVCVTGKPLREPSNFLVRIGTPVKELLDATGGLPETAAKVIGGGPMMGRAMVHTDVPVVKGTSGITVMDEKDAKRQPMQNCIRCAKCVSVCPMGLEPYLLSKLSMLNRLEDLRAENVMDCIECGSCSFTCPSSRPLLDYIRLGKGRVGAQLRAEAAAKKAAAEAEKAKAEAEKKETANA
ncbi:MAG: electron transport complex subunit RsxC [Bacteroidales bacterium]|nr:electron transport complex subunit RsxC [Bacteroidales bacterium]